MEVTHCLIHQPHWTVVSVRNHSHAVWQFWAAQACEEKGAVEVVGNCAIHRHGQCVESGTRGQYTHQQSLSDAQFSVNISSSAEVDK